MLNLWQFAIAQEWKDFFVSKKSCAHLTVDHMVQNGRFFHNMGLPISETEGNWTFSSNKRGHCAF